MVGGGEGGGGHCGATHSQVQSSPRQVQGVTHSRPRALLPTSSECRASKVASAALGTFSRSSSIVGVESLGASWWRWGVLGRRQREREREREREDVEATSQKTKPIRTPSSPSTLLWNFGSPVGSFSVLPQPPPRKTLEASAQVASSQIRRFLLPFAGRVPAEYLSSKQIFESVATEDWDGCHASQFWEEEEKRSDIRALTTLTGVIWGASFCECVSSCTEGSAPKGVTWSSLAWHLDAHDTLKPYEEHPVRTVPNRAAHAWRWWWISKKHTSGTWTAKVGIGMRDDDDDEQQEEGKNRTNSTAIKKKIIAWREGRQEEQRDVARKGRSDSRISSSSQDGSRGVQQELESLRSEAPDAEEATAGHHGTMAPWKRVKLFLHDHDAARGGKDRNSLEYAKQTPQKDWNPGGVTAGTPASQFSSISPDTSLIAQQQHLHPNDVSCFTSEKWA